MSSLPFFFQDPAFVFRDSSILMVTFTIDDCHIHFSVVENKLISLPRSPFGSFVLPNVFEKQQIIALIDQAILFGKSNGVDALEVKCYPEIYSIEKSKWIHEALTERGFLIKYTEVTQFLTLKNTLDLDRSRKTRLAQCQAEDYRFEKLTQERLAESYDLFLQSRVRKNYPITMQLSDLQAEFDRFSDRYELYGVLNKENELIAACVTVAVNNDILYYFFAGDSLAYRKFSPSTLLIYYLCQEAEQKQFKMIDLGISTDKGILNKGLYDFKKSFGSIDSNKLIFQLKI